LISKKSKAFVHFQLDSQRTKVDVLASQTVPMDRESKEYQKSFSTGRALSSAVEHFLHTEGVAGSNPAARTIFQLKW
jgi:hypothetical protein